MRNLEAIVVSNSQIMIAWDPPVVSAKAATLDNYLLSGTVHDAIKVTPQTGRNFYLMNDLKAEDDLGLAIVARYTAGLSPSPPVSFMKSTVDLRKFDTVLYLAFLLGVVLKSIIATSWLYRLMKRLDWTS